ncbi:MAG: response regulator, partial [Desulfuromonadales bacterium]|nr:response regulator [Desulfuromonadales bacterium]
MTKKLLLADDSLTIQKVIGIIFANEDYQLLVTDNGDAALEKARREHPDLVIADVSMPGKDGFQLCEAIRQTAGLEHVPFLLLPGTFELFDEDRARAVGANAWLNKPFESQVLLEKVEELLAAAPEPSHAPV